MVCEGKTRDDEDRLQRLEGTPTFECNEDPAGAGVYSLITPAATWWNDRAVWTLMGIPLRESPISKDTAYRVDTVPRSWSGDGANFVAACAHGRTAARSGDGSELSDARGYLWHEVPLPPQRREDQRVHFGRREEET